MQHDFSNESGKIAYNSEIPGRIRITVDALKSNQKLSNELINHLSNIQGIALVTANHYTGKILIIFDITKISSTTIKEEISTILQGRVSTSHKGNVVKADFKSKRSLALKEFQQAKNVLSKDCYDYNLQSNHPANNTSSSDTLWHTYSAEETLQMFGADISTGLSNAEVENALKKHGLNQFIKKEKRSIFAMFFGQFDSFIIKLLFAACSASIIIGQFLDAATILAIIGLEAALGTWQEYKAEKSLDALKQLSTPTAQVLRNGKKEEIQASKLVPGDIIILEAGNTVPADARLLESQNIQVVESSLTGEPYPVAKNPCSTLPKELNLADRNNMLYMGTSVVRGKGLAIVVSTGMQTEMGKIAGMLNSVEQEKTPLQKDLDKLGKIITWGCLGICGVIMFGGIIGGQPFLSMLSSAISLAVGAIPEGMTTALTISLAFGVQRMAKKNAIVKTLPAVETLSCTKVICTDKTGTLTKNEMTVKEIYTLENKLDITGDGYDIAGDIYSSGNMVDAAQDYNLKMLLTSAALCNNAEISKNSNGKYEIKGDPTEAALLIAVEKSGISLDSFDCYKREHEVPFESETKKMTAICSDQEGKYYIFTKGAMDTVLHKCSKIISAGAIVDITDFHKEQVYAANDEMAARALRVLALGYKPLDTKPDDYYADNLDEGMIFLGLLGMMDPPRPEVKTAIQKCHQAGIKVVMITGDHKNTAAAIAKSINLLTDDGIVLSGEELSTMTDEQLANTIDKIQVFARTCPEQKLKIVKAFKKKGYIVAMTGDGVNDAPALKEANIGIAMGKSGTDVTKDAASIILTDDNFDTIVKAVEEGRTINKNIKKFVKYVLSGNFAEVLAIFLASVSGLPAPLIPSQILLFNLVTEGIPALSLGVDPPEKDIMREAPRDPAKSIFDAKLRKRIITRGIATGLTTLGIFGATLFLGGNLVKARTAAFANLVSCQMFHALECSSMSIGKNKYLIPSVAISAGIMLATIYIPALSGIFTMVPLNIIDWAAILFSSLILSRIDDFLKDLLYVTKRRLRPSFGV